MPRESDADHNCDLVSPRVVLEAGEEDKHEHLSGHGLLLLW
jgi:hypothetical protein